jgi:hypothetical protein
MLLISLLFTLLAPSVNEPMLLSTNNECSIKLYNSNYTIVAVDNKTKIWEKEFNEPIKGITFIKMGDDDNLDFGRKYIIECLIKIVSKNYIYYLNTVNGNIVNKFHIIDNVINNNSFVECSNFRINKWCIRDIIYNGSIFINVINNKWSPNDKCGDGPNVGNRCVTNNISINHTFLGERLI